MVAKRKTPKDERELPPAARKNPYALLSRDELDAALKEIDEQLGKLTVDSDERRTLKHERDLVSQGYLWQMVRQGKAYWAGGKPKGLDPLVEVTPGPPISDYVIEDRR